MCAARRLFSSSRKAASVVDLPDPVRPPTRINPSRAVKRDESAGGAPRLDSLGVSRGKRRTANAQDSPMPYTCARQRFPQSVSGQSTLPS